MIALLFFHIASAGELPSPPEVTQEGGTSKSVSAAQANPPAVLWAGRMAVFGERKLPFIGTVTFRNDNYVLAKVVTAKDGTLNLEQRVCRIGFEKVAGAQASMNEVAARSTPPVTPRFVLESEGTLSAESWASGWDASDHDGDGYPGIAVQVSATLCGGTMHFASDAQTVARAKPHNDGIIGRANIRVAQEVHKVQGACLSLVTKDMTQDLRGVFGYFPVPAGSTCDSVPAEAWVDPTTFELSDIDAPALPEMTEK